VIKARVFVRRLALSDYVKAEELPAGSHSAFT